MRKVDLTYIIDDDSIFVFVLKKLLQKNDIFNRIEDFQNAHDVLNILSQNKETLPDIILLDLNMPIVDGWQFLDQIEKIPHKERLNIFIMSSSIDSNDIEKSKNYTTVKDFISKPINHDKLERLLEKI